MQPQQQQRGGVWLPWHAIRRHDERYQLATYPFTVRMNAEDEMLRWSCTPSGIASLAPSFVPHASSSCTPPAPLPRQNHSAATEPLLYSPRDRRHRPPRDAYTQCTRLHDREVTLSCVRSSALLFADYFNLYLLSFCSSYERGEPYGSTWTRLL